MLVTKSFESVEVRLGVASSLVVALYRSGASLTALEELDKLQTSLLQKHAKLSTLTLIGQLGSVLKVDEAVRVKSVELGKKYEKQVHGSAIVVTTKGLAAVMARTFLSGFFMVSRSETPMRTFATVSEGLAWLQSLPGQDMALKTELHLNDIEDFVA